MTALSKPVTPEMIGVVLWPYVNNAWNVQTRLDAIATHYEILSHYHSTKKVFEVSPSKSHLAFDFDNISGGVTIVIDQPSWFVREGELVANVFQADLRVASMAFVLAYKNNEIVAYIGAVQGIHAGVSTEKSLQIYKVLTKDFFGLRPRTLLLEVLKVISGRLGVKKIFGISEQNRHHRHPFFDNDENTIFNSNYNIFWEEHNGVINTETGFYEIPMALAVRDISTIASKKRGQYRKRNSFLTTLEDLAYLE